MPVNFLKIDKNSIPPEICLLVWNIEFMKLLVVTIAQVWRPFAMFDLEINLYLTWYELFNNTNNYKTRGSLRRLNFLKD